VRSKDYESKKAKTTYNLEWREYNIRKPFSMKSMSNILSKVEQIVML
jgi:hypothetical protein